MSPRSRHVVVLATALLAANGGTPASPGSPAPDPAGERGVPALFSWGDVDGDRRLDLAAVRGDGTLLLLASAGDGRFEDVTLRVGLAGVGKAALASWADYDGDGQLDLFVGARAGASRLYRNEQGVFVDMTAASGLANEGSVQSAQWLDHDGDGRLDLFVVTDHEGELSSRLFRGLDGGFFEPAELPLGGALSAPRVDSPAVVVDGADVDGGNAVGGAGGTGTVPATGSARDGDFTRAGRPSGGMDIHAATAPGSRLVRSSSPITGGGPALPLLGSCLPSIRDQASGACLAACTAPTLGMLYPLSANLFVATSGNVGIGTTSPAAKLDVAGSARVKGTLTLDPGVDKALDVGTGSIYKGGAPFLHTKGGAGNTALGREALSSATSGSFNTASGYRALFSSTTASYNTANGHKALTLDTTGGYNTASGANALRFNTTGGKNTAHGARALSSNTTGSFNTASGGEALRANTTGQRNTASGYRALSSSTTGSFNTAIGSEALRANTTGGLNTATGYRALYSNTTGYENTASGVRALRNNTTGFANTASGAFSLHSNTTGHYNTASGDGALYANTAGHNNTALGYAALGYTTAGDNTASGALALFSTTTGSANVAGGYAALYANTTGKYNTASGTVALVHNTIGTHNMASGAYALYSNTTGTYNTAAGTGALYYNTTGSYNIALGPFAGYKLTTGSDNIDIGHPGVAGESATIRIGETGVHKRAFVSGIRGVQTGANGVPVLVDNNGQLGTVSSSRRFKEDIRDMGGATEKLLALRPVVFRYKPEVQSGERPLEYGLIAEEVAEVFPDLVVYDEEGKPFTVKYHVLSSMLLNELQKLHERAGQQEEAGARALAELDELRAELSRLQQLETRLAALEENVDPLAEPRSCDDR